MRLDVLRAGERAQMRHHLVLVARRQQGGQQDDVRHTRAQGSNRCVARVDDDQFGAHALVDDPREHGGLTLVWHDGQDECELCVFQRGALLLPLRRPRTG